MQNIVPIGWVDFKGLTNKQTKIQNTIWHVSMIVIQAQCDLLPAVLWTCFFVPDVDKNPFIQITCR